MVRGPAKNEILTAMSKPDQKSEEMRFPGQLVHEVWDYPDLVLHARMTRALDQGSSSFGAFREVRFAATGSLDDVFDRLLDVPDWTVQRTDLRTALVETKDVLIRVEGSRHATYCSFWCGIWCASVARTQEIRESLLGIVEGVRITEPSFRVDWYFTPSRGALESARVEELAEPLPTDEAYPTIEGSLANFVDRYLSAPEPILVLQGPPGTGKTRLIRAILGELSRRNGESAQVIYTGDRFALENDEIYVRFITGTDDAFVVEDADHLLTPRADGNEHLHRFLSVSDGLVRIPSRKVMFSTNLPNIGDLDEALLRPGRCFAHVRTRALTTPEAEKLVERLHADTPPATTPKFHREGHSSHRLAEIYRAIDTAK
ncbi:MAG: hypothetical protein ACI9W2_001174 [Gammaproteobacteria bacterium]|jgi:hypothetical protein